MIQWAERKFNRILQKLRITTWPTRWRVDLLLGMILILGGTLGLGGIIILQSDNQPSTVVMSRVKIGVPLRDFSLADLNGKVVRLSDFSGKTVLINAWATWCPPCKEEMPALNQYYQAHQAQGFVILAVNGGDAQTSAADFASQYGLLFPVLLDPGASVLDGLGIFSFPTSILIGRDGTVKSVHLGKFTTQSLETDITPFLQ